MAIVVAQPAAAAEVRFLHAVPGGPKAYLQVGGTALGNVGFGQASMYARTPDGKVSLALIAGGKRLALVTPTLEDRRYTVVASTVGKRIVLRTFSDGPARAGSARVRAVHVVPELDEAGFTAGSKSLGEVGRGEASDYATVRPGDYGIEAAQPGGDMVAERGGVNLAAGTASSAYLLGSAGERTRFVVLQDTVAAPALAPATGLGGLADEDQPWLAALAAALIAGTLGGLGYKRASARRSRGIA